MRTKHLPACVLIHIRTKDEVGTVKHTCIQEVSEYDQQIPQLHTADQLTTP